MKGRTWDQFRCLVDCKTVGFFLKISQEIGKAWRKSLTREAREPHTPVGIFSVSPQSRSLFSASFQTFCLTARAYLHTQKIRTVLQSRCLGNYPPTPPLSHHFAQREKFSVNVSLGEG